MEIWWSGPLMELVIEGVGAPGGPQPPHIQASALLKFSSTFLGLIWQRKR